MAIPIEQDSLHARLASSVPLPPMRHVAVRAFWSVVAFLLLSGMVVSCLAALLVRDVYDDADARHGVITVCVACACGLAFVLRKTTLRKRTTFWRETLRPFLQSLTAIGIGAAIVALVTRSDLPDEALLAVYSVLVMSSILFLLLLFARGHHRPPAPFLIDQGPGRRRGHRGAAETAPGSEPREARRDDRAETGVTP
jgi:hypothetical protein